MSDRDRWGNGVRWMPAADRTYAGPTPPPAGSRRCAGDPGCPYRLRADSRHTLCRWHASLRTAPSHWLTGHPAGDEPQRAHRRRSTTVAQPVRTGGVVR